MSSGRATADRLYAALKLQLEPAGIAGRAASATSSELWVAAALLGGHIGPELLDAAPETVAEQVVEHRLERLFLGLWLSLDDELTATVGTIHVRPLRSALHAAFTLPLDNGALIVIDDAAYDLTHTAATVMMASWGSPDAAIPDGAPPPVPFNDAVRVLRAELGSMRWNGALWQPVRVLLSDADRATASVLGDWAITFILAHEIGHVALGHFTRSGAAGGPRTSDDEHAADVSAARALLRHVLATHPDPAPHRTDLTALVRTAIRIALGIVHVVSSTYLVAGDDHPPIEARLAVISDAVMPGLATQPAERPAELLFHAMDNLVLATDTPLSAIVAAQPGLDFAAPFTAAELTQLDRLDRTEGLFHTGLPTLLYALGEAVLGDDRTPFPRGVIEAAERADAINCEDRDVRSVPTESWVRCAVGRWWLLEQLIGSRPDDEATAALDPPPATRFCDWAGWMEDACPEEMLGIALAGLLAYAQHGQNADGVAMTESGLLIEVRRWREAPADGAGASTV